MGWGKQFFFPSNTMWVTWCCRFSFATQFGWINNFSFFWCFTLIKSPRWCYYWHNSLIVWDALCRHACLYCQYCYATIAINREADGFTLTKRKDSDCQAEWVLFTLAIPYIALLPGPVFWLQETESWAGAWEQDCISVVENWNFKICMHFKFECASMSISNLAAVPPS